MEERYSELYSKDDFLNFEIGKKHWQLLDEAVEDGRPYCEMSAFDNAFLFGLLEEKKPKKILEIGVAAGATTLMLLSYMQESLPESKLYSIDYLVDYYRDQTKKSGFLASKSFSESPQWKLFLGTTFPLVADEIGGDVDFCILDTVHCLPGELLDFIAMLPYMKDGSIVVLHDVQLPLNIPDGPYDDRTLFAYATKIVLDVAKGKKIICRLPDVHHGLANISAIVIDKETRASIKDLFSALSLIWYYIPPEKDTKVYADFYERHYTAEYANYFRRVVSAQTETAPKLQHLFDKIRHRELLLTEVEECRKAAENFKRDSEKYRLSAEEYSAKAEKYRILSEESKEIAEKYRIIAEEYIGIKEYLKSILPRFAVQGMKKLISRIIKK